MSDKKYKLHYFNSRGRAEIIRLVFAAANVSYEDIRFTREDWPNIKSTIPSGRVPYVETPEGEGMEQSLAISRYLALKNNLYPSDVQQVYAVERAIGQISDVFDELYKVYFAPEDKKADAKKEFTEGKAKPLLQDLVRYLENKKYFGNELSLADLYFLTAYDYIGGFFDFSKDYPRLLQLVEDVKKDNAGVATWLESRPLTPF